MEDHWNAGAADVMTTLASPEWLSRKRPDEEVIVFDCTKELDKRSSKERAHEN